MRKLVSFKPSAPFLKVFSIMKDFTEIAEMIFDVIRYNPMGFTKAETIKRVSETLESIYKDSRIDLGMELIKNNKGIK